jgi:hypothetical protein
MSKKKEENREEGRRKDLQLNRRQVLDLARKLIVVSGASATATALEVIHDEQRSADPATLIEEKERATLLTAATVLITAARGVGRHIEESEEQNSQEKKTTTAADIAKGGPKGPGARGKDDSGHRR